MSDPTVVDPNESEEPDPSPVNPNPNDLSDPDVQDNMRMDYESLLGAIENVHTQIENFGEKYFPDEEEEEEEDDLDDEDVEEDDDEDDSVD